MEQELPQEIKDTLEATETSLREMIKGHKVLLKHLTDSSEYATLLDKEFHRLSDLIDELLEATE